MSSVMSTVRIGCANSWFWYQKAPVLPGLSIEFFHRFIFFFYAAPFLSFINTAHKVQFSFSGK